MKKILAAVLLAMLGGCAVYPAGAVYVQPAPVIYPQPYYYGPVIYPQVFFHFGRRYHR